MLLYISGFGSSYKPWIKTMLREKFGEGALYYLLRNDFAQDSANLDAICRAATGEICVVGHSTGGFLGLYLRTLHPHIAQIYLINPAIDLLWSMDGNPEAKDFLVQRPLIAAAFERIMAQPPGIPLTLYQGRHDDRVHIPFNEDFVRRADGRILHYDMGHRFDEAELDAFLSDVKATRR